MSDDQVRVHLITPDTLDDMMDAARAGDRELCSALDCADDFAGRKQQVCSNCRTKFSASERPMVFVVIHDGDDALTAGFCRSCAEAEDFEEMIGEQLEALGIVPGVLQ
jgi:hypothetical protein